MGLLLSGAIIWLLGLAVGSFLNVVVYRLGAGLSVSSPRWSFCPACGHVIRARDNVPVLSWLLLRGRCRDCRAPISVQYPLVEAATGLAFALVFHFLAVERARSGLGDFMLPGDVPLLLAWLTLVAGLIACSAMDLVSYTIDVRVTNVVLGVGLAAHAVWPRGEPLVAQAGSAPIAAAAAAAVVGAVTAWWIGRRWVATVDGGEAAAEAPPATQPAPAAKLGPTTQFTIVGLVGTLAAVALAGLVLLAPAMTQSDGGQLARWLPSFALGLLFIMLVVAGSHKRPADEDIVAAIESERHLARRAAAGELLMLLPAIVVAAGVAWVIGGAAGGSQAWRSLVAWGPVAGAVPLAGLVSALAGAGIAAAAGWAFRIGFTLIYGREAFGVGDIHILAAAGACAGWDIAVLGLMCSVGIALAGWILGLLMKSTGMIPLGPWLALGMLVALWINRPAEDYVTHQLAALREAWQTRPDFVLMLGGVMLVAFAGAIGLSRLVTRLAVPQHEAGEDGSRLGD